MGFRRRSRAAQARVRRRLRVRMRFGGRHTIRRRFRMVAPGAGFKSGLITPYRGGTNDATIFKCPAEKQWQCSYGLNYCTGSPAGKNEGSVTETSVRLVAWDHRRTPGCADSRIGTPPRPPFLPFVGTASETHYPPRHSGRMNGLFYDGHVQGLRPVDLRVRNFREPGSAPMIAGYPGE